MPRAFAPNAHHLGHWTKAAWSGLRPAPESRSRGARPHLLRSFTTRFSSLAPPFLVSLQHTIAQEVELAFRDPTDSCLLLIDRELQCTHDRAQLLQGLFGLTSLAQNHEVVRVGHNAGTEALLQPELLPSQALGSPECRLCARANGWRRNDAYVVGDIGATMSPSGLCRVLSVLARLS